MSAVGEPRSTGDFHCHSSRSDGTLEPDVLVDLAAGHGVRALALTDHDTIDGIEAARAAAARHPGMLLVPGVELSCDLPGTEVHLIGLFVDPGDAEFRAAIDRMRHGRIARGRRITEALGSLGAPVSWVRVQEIAGDASIGRPHIARALIEAGHVADVDEAFERYLGNDSPAYVPRERVEPEEAIALVRGAGGVAIFAHPGFTEDYEAVAEQLATAGLFGMEVYYRDYPPEQVTTLLALSERLGLIPSGGSDYHGLPRRREVEPGCITFPDEAVERLLDEAASRGCVVPGRTA